MFHKVRGFVKVLSRFLTKYLLMRRMLMLGLIIWQKETSMHFLIWLVCLSSGPSTVGEPIPATHHLFQAVRDKDYDYLQELLDCGGTLTIRDKQGRTPFLWAAEKDERAMASYLLVREPAIDSRYPNGETALIRAAREGRFDTFIFLQQRGADLLLTDHDGLSAREHARLAGHTEIATFLDDLIDNFPAQKPKERESVRLKLRTKIKRNASREHILGFIRKGAYLNAYHPLKEKPVLFEPLRKGRKRLLETLLDLGANPMDSFENRAPLDVLPGNHSFPGMRLALKEHGALSYGNVKDRNHFLMAVEKGDRRNLETYAKRLNYRFNFRGPDSKTPLMHGAYFGQVTSVRFLLDSGVAVDTIAPDGWDALSLAVFSGNEDVVGTLIAAGGNPHTQVENLSLLHMAVLNGHHEVLLLLIDAGLDVNQPGPELSTALHYACLKKDTDMAMALYFAGADPQRLNVRRETAIDIAIRLELSDLMDAWMPGAFSQEKGSGKLLQSQVHEVLPEVRRHDQRWEDAFLWALSSGKVKSADVFISKGFAVNDILSNGWTPLMYAAAYNQPEMIGYLIERGARVNQSTMRHKTTPLMIAAIHGYMPVLQALLENGADQKRLSRSGHSAFSLAVVGGHLEAVRLLHKRGSRPDYHALSEPILSLPASQGNLAMIRALLAMGQSANQSNKHGWTPLMVAARANKVEAARLLVEHKASVNRITEDGWTALTFAASKGHMEMVHALLDMGAHPLLKVGKGPTPLNVAQRNGHDAVAKLLESVK